MKHAGPAIYMVLTTLGLYVLLALSSGSAWLFPTQRMINRSRQPVGYWALVGGAATILVALVGLLVSPLFGG